MTPLENAASPEASKVFDTCTPGGGGGKQTQHFEQVRKASLIAAHPCGAPIFPGLFSLPRS